MSGVVQVLYCSIGFALIGAGVFSLFEVGFLGILVAVPLSLPGIYCCRWALASRLTLSDTEISVRYAFDENFVDISRIEGWRTEAGGRSGPWWVLQFRNNTGSLRIDQKFAVDDAFLDFLSRLRNLNDGEISIAP
jgi:hypothetical protein